MSFDRPSRYTAPATDTTTPAAQGSVHSLVSAPSLTVPVPDPDELPLSPEERRLEELAEALCEFGEKATVRRVIGGRPFLMAQGAGGEARLSERIEAGRRADGTVFAALSWGQELPDDVAEAAVVVRRVINPAV